MLFLFVITLGEKEKERETAIRVKGSTHSHSIKICWLSIQQTLSKEYCRFCLQHRFFKVLFKLILQILPFQIGKFYYGRKECVTLARGASTANFRAIFLE